MGKTPEARPCCPDGRLPPAAVAADTVAGGRWWAEAQGGCRAAALADVGGWMICVVGEVRGLGSCRGCPSGAAAAQV
eukprot:scaffold211377_cov19-Tisochrysis_lutea.AAC.1